MELHWSVVLLMVAAGTVAGHWATKRSLSGVGHVDPRKLVRRLLEAHFRSRALDDITVTERQFPFRVRADLQRAIDQLFIAPTVIRHFCGVRKDHAFDGITIGALLVDGHSPAVSVPPQYEEVDVGDDVPVRCLKNGLWLLDAGGVRHAVLLSPAGRPYGETTGIQFQIATPNSPAGTQLTQAFFRRLEEAILKAESYRGKVLSLERHEHLYSGEATGITVHRLKPIPRDDVILPVKTLELLDRNVIHFSQQRRRLAQLGLATKKGLLFYGPPGTGKTMTIHYLAGALAGHTTLLISADQVSLLAEYMTLARLLQPSIVVLEDVDLIARAREDMSGPCQESLLNRLLNEMDGLQPDADILFLLTTNRPAALEAALASRPGRVDQAIEFPLPDPAGRDRLVRLYARGFQLADDVICTIVQRTEKVSAAFIKELMRRSVQFHLERDGNGQIEWPDVEQALAEMLFSGGSLNLKLLGAEGADGFGFRRHAPV